MDPVYTISIIPTGMGAAGYTMPLPDNDEMFNTKNKMRKYMEQDRMACFMISCDLFLFIRDDLALLFCTDPDLDECFLDILLHDIRTALFCSINSSFVKKILQICACKSCGCLGDLAKIHIISQRFVLGMDHKDLFSALDIRASHTDFTVKSSRTEDRRIQNIHTV